MTHPSKGHLFGVGQEVVSKSKYSMNRRGFVWKVSAYGVHVKFNGDDMYQIFHFKPTHHMQSPLCELTSTDHSTIKSLTT